jgi:ribosomal protein L11 methyltransferase
MPEESDPKPNVSTDPSKACVEVSVTAPKTIEEELADFLIDNVVGGSGLILEDRNADVLIRFYVPCDGDAQLEPGKISRFLAQSGAVEVQSIPGRITSKRIREIEWVREYQRSFEPVEVGDVVIKSIWSENDPVDRIVIALEPKMAFGTGKHETTQLCVYAVRNAVKGGEIVLDLGTGSGILAILAAKLGAANVLGLDLNSAAVENARENIKRNEVNGRVTIEYGSMQKVKKRDHYDIVISNLIRDGIFELFDDFVRAAKPGGIMILSGILTDQIEEMNRFFERRGYADFEITTKNEWACYQFGV